jgi:hypothetical protein
MLARKRLVHFGGLHHRDQMFRRPALAPRGEAHAVAYLEQPRHVLGPLDITAEPEQVLGGAA